MLVHVAAMSDDLRSDLQSLDDFNTLIEANAKKLDTFFKTGEYVLKQNWGLVMKGGNKSIRTALDPFKDSVVTTKQTMLGLFICRRKVVVGKDVTYVVMQSAHAHWRYCNQFVSDASPLDTDEDNKIKLKEVITALENSYT